MKTYVGLIACDDQPGLVHRITGEFFKNKANITENIEYVDHKSKRFFMRTEFEGSVKPIELQNSLLKTLPKKSHCAIREVRHRKLVVMTSRETHCLGDLLLRHHMKELNAEIMAVVSQHEDARDLTERFGLPFEFVPFKKDRIEHEARLLKVIKPMKPDFIVLARYMRIFSPEFVNNFREQMINIHHSFLPAFIGRNPYEQAHERGVKIIGATSHFVTDNLDEGPIITQDVAHVDHTASPEAMARRGQDIEKLVLARGLKLILDDRVLVEGNRTVIFQ